MKILKYNESNNNIPSNDGELLKFIEKIMDHKLDMIQIKYTDDFEIDTNSIKLAAENIITELKTLGVDFNLIYETKKFNI
jgi:hypothetical protein